jgi:hypothetical protein
VSHAHVAIKTTKSVKLQDLSKLRPARTGDFAAFGRGCTFRRMPSGGAASPA